MKQKISWPRVIYITGIVALVIGTIDPLEGSVAIVAGSLLLTTAVYMSHESHRKLFLLSSILISIGVFFLFYFSSLGGFGGSSTLSWWWGTLILPYPAGWIMSVILLIARAVKRKKLQAS